MSPRVTMILRILLGIFILVFGVNKFANFLEFPSIPGDGGDLMRIYFTSGFLKIIGVLEILAGIALLANKYVPLALTFSVAIMLNAAIFHGLHDLPNIGGAMVGLILSLVVLFGGYRERFSSLLSA